MNYLLLYQYTLIAFVLLRECKAAFLCHALLIFIYSMMGQLISKYEPFWQEVSVESLISRWLLMLWVIVWIIKVIFEFVSLIIINVHFRQFVSKKNWVFSKSSFLLFLSIKIFYSNSEIHLALLFDYNIIFKSSWKL